jgi:hypothetical protein
MTSSSVQAIIQALNQAGVRYLVRMKKAAGRPQDLSDIEQLEIPSGDRDDD